MKFGARLATVIFLFGACSLGYAAEQETSPQAQEFHCPAGSQVVERGSFAGCERTLENGRRMRAGRWIARDSAQHVVQDVTYDNAGMPVDGTLALYFENGQKKEERHYRYGKLHGVRKRWKENGEPNGAECFIENDRRRLDDCAAFGD